MAILPSVLLGLATYAGFVEVLITKMFESQMRRYGAALPKREQKPRFKRSDRTIAAKYAPARKA